MVPTPGLTESSKNHTLHGNMKQSVSFQQVSGYTLKRRWRGQMEKQSVPHSNRDQGNLKCQGRESCSSSVSITKGTSKSGNPVIPLSYLWCHPVSEGSTSTLVMEWPNFLPQALGQPEPLPLAMCMTCKAVIIMPSRAFQNPKPLLKVRLSISDAGLPKLSTPSSHAQLS